MIRQPLSEALSDIANTVMPNAFADGWRSKNFNVLMDKIRWANAAFNSDDGLWRGVAILEGRFQVRIVSDDGTLDPSPLMLYLRENPLLITPDNNAPAGSYAVQIKFKPDTMDDMMMGDTMGVVPVLIAPCEDCYVIQRTDFPLGSVPASVVDNVEMI